MVVAAVLSLCADAAAARDDDEAIRHRIARLQQDVAREQATQNRAKLEMAAAVKEGEAVKPKLEAARKQQASDRAALTAARRANALAVKSIRERIDRHPSVVRRVCSVCTYTTYTRRCCTRWASTTRS